MSVRLFSLPLPALFLVLTLFHVKTPLFLLFFPLNPALLSLPLPKTLTNRSLTLRPLLAQFLNPPGPLSPPTLLSHPLSYTLLPLCPTAPRLEPLVRLPVDPVFPPVKSSSTRCSPLHPLPFPSFTLPLAHEPSPLFPPPPSGLLRAWSLLTAKTLLPPPLSLFPTPLSSPLLTHAHPCPPPRGVTPSWIPLLLSLGKQLLLPPRVLDPLMVHPLLLLVLTPLLLFFFP